ncbi:MAG TPA: hypothetical protein PKZ36_00625 [Candidatus Paceibacterota bacterium]|nr:hypothetical protein [Candidatus Paceibacterota bacterium]HPT17904.1 hypothetical protein [Candidatus Paceibacterota bacterium]
MAKRGTTLSPKKKSRHSHKTKKRLEAKRLMLAKKASRKNNI